MKEDLSHLHHLKDPDEFYTLIGESWKDFYKTQNDAGGLRYKQSIQLLDSLASESYRGFVLFNVRKMEVLHLTPNIYKLVGHQKAEMDKIGPSFFFKIMVLRHFKYWIKILLWIKINREEKNEKILSQNKYSIIYKGLRFKKKNGEEISTLFRQIVPKGHQRSELMLLEFFEVTHLVDDDHFSMRVHVIGNSKALIYNHTKKDYSKSGDVFSEREFEILMEMAKGNTTEEIAKELFISPRTVSTHKRNMLDKIGAKDASSMLELCKLMGIAGL